MFKSEYFVKFIYSCEDIEKVLYEETFDDYDLAFEMYDRYLGCEDRLSDKNKYYYYKIMIKSNNETHIYETLFNDIYTEIEARKEKIRKFIKDIKD